VSITSAEIDQQSRQSQKTTSRHPEDLQGNSRHAGAAFYLEHSRQQTAKTTTLYINTNVAAASCNGARQQQSKQTHMKIAGFSRVNWNVGSSLSIDVCI
jgi:hypothetical protein